MQSQATVTSCKAALVTFGLVFLVCFLRGFDMFGAALRGAAAALVVFLFVKVLSHFFFNAVVEELSEFVRREKKTPRP